MNYQIGVGIVAALWALSMEIRLRRANNEKVVAQQAEKDAKIASIARTLSDAEREHLATDALEHYSPD